VEDIITIATVIIAVANNIFGVNVDKNFKACPTVLSFSRQQYTSPSLVLQLVKIWHVC